MTPPALADALPQLIAAYHKLGSLAAAHGITFDVAPFGGVRTQADTTKIIGYRAQDYAAAVRVNPDTASIPIDQWRPIAPYGDSYHNFGAAFDAEIVARPAGMSDAQALAVLGELAPQCGLRWGGTFPSNRTDLPHFELAISLADARAEWGRHVGGIQGTNLPDITQGFNLADFLKGGSGFSLPPVPNVSVIPTETGYSIVPVPNLQPPDVGITADFAKLTSASNISAMLNTKLAGVPVWAWAVGLVGVALAAGGKYRET